MTSEPPRTVFFLSDFGTADEFAGVVHALIAARAPGTTVIDLTHHVPPFDVRAGSHTLVRAVPHLGPGVVLAVVDPGVGTARRGIALEVPRLAGGTLCFVGPDNGLLVAAAEAAGEAPVTRLVELARDPAPREPWVHLRRARPVRPGGRGALRRRGAGEARRADRPGVAGAPRRRRGRDGAPARRPGLPAGRGHVGGPLRQPAAGGDGGRRPGGRDPADRAASSWRHGSSRAVRTSTGCRTRSCPTACNCAASTPSASCNTGSSACSSTPTGISPSWPGSRRRRTGSTSWPGSCSFWPGDAGRRFGAAGSRLGTIRRNERRAAQSRRVRRVCRARGGSPRPRCCACPSTSASWPSWSAPARARSPPSSWPSWPGSTRPRCARTCRCWARSAPGVRATSPSS